MAMRKFCKALPEDRRLLGNEDTLETLLAKEKGVRVYVEPSTGAKLTYGNALVYLANFVSTLQQVMTDDYKRTSASKYPFHFI